MMRLMSSVVDLDRKLLQQYNNPISNYKTDNTLDQELSESVYILRQLIYKSILLIKSTI